MMCTIVRTIICTINDVKLVSLSSLKLNECSKAEYGLLVWGTESSERMISLSSPAQLMRHCFLRGAVYRDR